MAQAWLCLYNTHRLNQSQVPYNLYIYIVSLSIALSVDATKSIVQLFDLSNQFSTHTRTYKMRTKGIFCHMDYMMLDLLFNIQLLESNSEIRMYMYVNKWGGNGDRAFCVCSSGELFVNAFIYLICIHIYPPHKYPCFYCLFLCVNSTSRFTTIFLYCISCFINVYW